MKILIADDSALIVDRLTHLLKDVPGIEIVGQAGDVTAAVRYIQQLNPDVVILEPRMPGGSGLDVLRAIRLSHPRLHVVVCTNFPNSQHREECYSAGAHFFLDKSTEFEEIPAILTGLIHNSA